MTFRLLAGSIFFAYICLAQGPGGGAGATAAGAAGATAGAAASGGEGRHDHTADRTMKMLSDAEFYHRLGDIADVDQIRYTGPPPAKITNPTAPGAKNPLIIHAFTFIPKKLDRTKKNPLIVFAHEGVHNNFNSEMYVHIMRELMEEGYAVIAPDYRGSTGYGAQFYDQIDYGGKEVDDVFLAREWMLERYSFLDPKRVGIVGSSHGGLITLMNIFQHPEAFAVAYAGVPVTDLVTRLGYHDASYQAIFSAKTHIGKTVREDIQEYLKRSPITYADKLATPLLIHSNTNDEDVNVLEVRRLITALKAEGKKFEYKIYEDAPGGHHFTQLDTKLGMEARKQIYAFLAKYLKQ